MKINNLIRYFKLFWVLLFPLSSYYFFGYSGIDSNILKAIYFIVLPITFLLSFKQFFISKRNYSKIITSIIVLIIFSIIMAWVFHNQSLVLGYRITAIFIAMVYFFYLSSLKLKFYEIEKLIWILTAIYIVVWLIGLYYAPIPIFAYNNDTVDDSRGFFRLNLPGASILILALFLSLNKYIITRKKKWFFFILLFFIIILLHVVRQVIIFSLIISLFYISYKTKLKWIILILCIGIIFLPKDITTTNDDSIISKLILLSKDQAKEQKQGEEDIRIQEYKYYFSNYSQNIFTVLFGNGQSHSESSYGKSDIVLANDKGYFANDVGYADIYVRHGLISLILFIIIFYKVVRQDVNEKYMYAKLYIFYLIFASIASSPLLFDQITNSIVLYILELDYLKNRYIKIKNIKNNL